MRLLAVDGNGLAHRAYHAMAAEADGSGFVVAGIITMLATAWWEGPFDGVLVAFDDPAGLRRRELEPAYKTHRPSPPPQLLVELDAAPTLLEEAGLAVARSPGAEADDLLAATADACVARGWHCVLLSSDRDLVALVSDDVTLLRPRRSMRDLGVYDPPAVLAEFGVPPHRYTDLAALRGDPSDGLAGVPGVGSKTAAKLVATYGGIPDIYAALPHLQPRLEAALRTARPTVERNLLLMAPMPHLQVDIEAATRPVDIERVARVLEPLGQAEAADRLRRALERPARPPLPPVPPPPDLPRRPPLAARPAIDLAAAEQAALF